jgi:hypothetical protein
MWGFVCSTRAVQRLRPSIVIGYLIGAIHERAKRYIGHNPAVIALLAMLSVTCATASRR